MRKIPFLGAAVAAVAVTGCDQSMVGNLPISADDFPPMVGETTVVVGTVVEGEGEVDAEEGEEHGNGCFVLHTDEGHVYWVVWPEGAKRAFVNPPRDYDPGVIKLKDGTVIDVGDRVELTGQSQTRRELPDGDIPDSMWGAFAGFCINDEISDDEVFRAAEARLIG